MLNAQSFSEFLQQNLASRTGRNSSYSLRSFARDLGVSPGHVSLWLNEKKGVSIRTVKSIASKLGLTAAETEHLVLLAEAQSARSAVKKRIAQNELQKKIGEDKNFSLDIFQAISEWYHYAILELAALPNFKADSSSIAARLEISKYEVEMAIMRLVKLELLTETKEGLKPTKDISISPSGIPSSAIRKHHHQILQKAQGALEFTPINERDFASMTLTFHPSDIERAKEKLKIFRREFAQEFGNNKKPESRIYALGIQLFPLDKGEKK